METRPGEEPTRELTPSEAGTLEEKEADNKQAIDEVRAPFEDEADRLRAKALEIHYNDELKPLEKSQLELARKARREAPPVIRNPRNKPPHKK